MKCVDEAVLERLFARRQSFRDQAQLDAHLDHCERCRALVAMAARAQSGTELEPAPEPLGRLAPLPRLAPGTLVDSFEVKQLLGRGGMGEVYLARDSKLARKVALKIIHPDSLGGATPRDIERFLLEARITARFSHPGIVQVYAVGEHEGTPYLALEFLDGENLRKRMRSERLAASEAARILLAVAQALAEAHSHGVLHRDLKPENIFLAKDGRPRILDFGLAAHLASASDGNEVGAPRALGESRPGGGTPSYMAPEQWTPGRAATASDIWALGVILFEMVAGRHPFAVKSLRQLRVQVTEGPAPSPDGVADLPGPLADLLRRCLERRLADRPSATQVAQSLQAFLQPSRATPLEGCPFRGLSAFAEQHRDLFFGRETEVAAFVERMREEPILPVVGPSGAGKSSFVMAGVIPRLREQGSWRVLHLRPGPHPFAALAAHILGANGTAAERADDEARLARKLGEQPRLLSLLLHEQARAHGSRVLLFVDQLEELFTLAQTDTERRAFLEALYAGAQDARDPVRIVYTIREDFLHRLAVTPEVRAALSRITLLQCPSRSALAQTLTKPLETVGYTFEDPQLATDMVAAVAESSECLPLLQFAARSLWDDRDTHHRTLRRSSYEAMGGVAGALARHADGVLAQMVPGELDAARLLLLRLVTPEHTRRVMPLPAALATLGAMGAGVLDRLREARLIVVRQSHEDPRGSGEVELAHESLLSHWGRLKRWQDENRDDLETHRFLLAAARQWSRGGRRAADLLQGPSLGQSLAWRACQAERLETEVGEFLERSEAAARRRQSRQRRVRRAFLVSCLFVAAGSALGAAWIARQAHIARESQRRAELQRAEAQSEGARAALLRGDLLEARSKLRSSLETADSTLARALFWQISGDPLLWKRELGATLNAVAFSPDGQTLAAASLDMSVHLLDPTTGAGRILRGPLDQVSALAYSPVGDFLASGDITGALWLWDLHADARGRLFANRAGIIRGLDVSPDGKRLAVGTTSGAIELWSIAQVKVVRTLGPHPGGIFGIAWSRNAGLIATAGGDGTIRLWDPESGVERRRLSGHHGEAITVTFGPDGRLVASAGRDGTIRLWDLQGRAPPRVLTPGGAAVSALAFRPDGRVLASAGADRSIRLWDLPSGNLLGRLEGHQGQIFGLAFSPDGRALLSGDGEGSARLWAPERASAERTKELHLTGAEGGAVSPDGQLLATPSGDGTIALWDVRTGRLERLLTGHRGAVACLAFSPDGHVLASGSADKTIRLWDVASGEQVRLILGHEDYVGALAFRPDGKILVSGGWDATIRLWDARTGNSLGEIRGHPGKIYGLAFHPGGRILASSGADANVRLWAIPGGQTRGVLRGHRDVVWTVAFSPDGRTLASGSDDSTIRLWDLSSGSSTRLAQPSLARVLSYHPDGRRLAVEYSDGTVRVLDRTGRELALVGNLTFHDNEADFNHVLFSPDGRLLATTRNDGSVRLWQSDSGKAYWRAPALLHEPLQLLSHTGWVNLSPAPPSPDPVAATQWRTALERRARFASQAETGALLCLYTEDEHLEAWDMHADRLRFGVPLPGIVRLVATPDACATLAQGRVRLYAAQEGVKELSTTRVTTFAIDATGILTASQAGLIELFDRSGARFATLASDPGVQTMARTAHGIAVGYRDGSLGLISALTGSGPQVAFENPTAAAPTRMLAGPAGTLVVGYANGTLGLWDLTTGARLAQTRLHGPIAYLVLKDEKLYAATELGQHLAWDLSSFSLGECELLRRVWADVPVSWEAGKPVARRPPADHLCLRGSPG